MKTKRDVESRLLVSPLVDFMTAQRLAVVVGRCRFDPRLREPSYPSGLPAWASRVSTNGQGREGDGKNPMDAAHKAGALRERGVC